MLLVNRERGEILDKHFYDLPELLTSRDRLVFNDTRVIPARLFGTLEPGGQGVVEILLVEKISDSRWVCLGRPLRKIRAKGRVIFSPTLWCEVVPDSGALDRVTVEFHTESSTHISMAIAEHGCMPIPPYIRGGKGDELDEIDYQTIFATHPGSVAAPTASLHFNDELMKRLKGESGCEVSRVTLHVGTASFLPVLDDDGQLVRPGSERFHVSEETQRDVMTTKDAGGRVVAVGTTVVRALESVAQAPDGGTTELFITPGHTFRCVDSLITNFHQPGTTHLLLVESLLGHELLEKVYRHALNNDYRFLSYGDGMFIV
jgi:S-adenosylmethionine:tRNA ribosyltransferase-isomerase